VTASNIRTGWASRLACTGIGDPSRGRSAKGTMSDLPADHPRGVATPGRPASATHVVRQFAGAMLGTALGLLPVLTLGALASLIRPELDFSESRLGLATAAFFAASAAFSVPAGNLADRRGAARTAQWAVALGVVSLVGIGALSRSWATLLPWMVIGGAGNAAAQVATNGLVASVIPPDRNGVAFGLKQSATPLASLLTGVSVPLIGLTLGWRWTFVCAATISIPALVVLRRAGREPESRVARAGARLTSRRRPLVFLAASAALAASAVNCLNVFYVSSAVHAGAGLATAGVYFAVGGLSGIVVRVLGGWWSDRARLPRLTLASVFLLAGSAAFLGMGFFDSLLLPLTLVAFGAGWGWNGLVLAAVVDAYPLTPSAATSFTQSGLYVGAVVGPPTFGALVQYVGYTAAWSAGAAALAVGAVLVLVSSRAIKPAGG
jgi:MFS family permease